MNFLLSVRKYAKNNTYLMLAWRLGIVFILYSLQRVLFYWYNISFYPNVSAPHLLKLMVSGFKFDLTALLYVNSIFLLMMAVPITFKYNRWYKLVAKWIFLITNSVAFLANIIDFVYFRYTLRRTDFGVFTEFENEVNLTKIFGVAILQNWYLVFLFVALIAVLYFTYGDHERSSITKSPWAFYPVSLAMMFVAAVLSVVGIRGGYEAGTRPISISNALEKVEEPIETAIVLNTPFSLIETVPQTRLTRVNYYSEKELEEIYNPIHKGAPKGSFKADNVVVLILESFTKEIVGSLNHDLENGTYKGYTPFLDSLIEHGHAWEYSYANGRKSIDAIPSVIGGIPSLVQPYVLSRYSLNDIGGLAATLKKRGYYTSFFHGAPNASMGFKAITNTLSVDHYYGMEEYGEKKEDDGFWGINDEPYLSYCADAFSKLPQPFFASVFTLSSHHPFKVPDKYKGKFREGKHPLYQVVQYSDMAIQHFFEKASKTDWYNHTLFVLSADHSLTLTDHEKYLSTIGSFAIPIIFFSPGDSLVAGFDSSLVQQIDIFPSVMGLLHYDEPYFAFGNDRFDPNEKPFVVNYNNGIYQFLSDGYMIQYDGTKIISLYNYQKDIEQKNNLLGQNPAVEEVLFRKLKAFIQQYNNRMIDNRMRVEDSK